MTEGTKGIRPDEVLSAEGESQVQMRRLVTDAALLIPNILKLVGRLVVDPRVPRRAKITLGMAAAYVMSPVDLIPEMIPVVGWADDILILTFAIDSLIDRAGSEIVDEHWDGPGDLLSLVREIVGLSRSVIPRRITSVIDRLSG